MSSDKARDALSQCLPVLFNKTGLQCLGRIGYRTMADAVCDNLHRRGFRIVSHATYERMNENRVTPHATHHRALQAAE